MLTLILLKFIAFLEISSILNTIQSAVFILPVVDASFYSAEDTSSVTVTHRWSRSALGRLNQTKPGSLRRCTGIDRFPCPGRNPLLFQEICHANNTVCINSLDVLLCLRRNPDDYCGPCWKRTAFPVYVTDGFGFAVSVDSNIAAVGTTGFAAPGYVSIFEKNPVSGIWIQAKRISRGETDNSFGYPVLVRGQSLWVGSPQAGVVYGFQKNISGKWEESYQLTAPGTAALAQDKFLVVGAANNNVGSVQYAGEVYLFVQERGAKNWTQCHVFTASDASFNSNFGSSVATLDDAVLVGAISRNSNTGAAYLYERCLWNGNWTETKLIPVGLNAGSYFGSAVAFFGNREVLVGAPGHKSNTGAVFIFKRGITSKGSWVQTNALTPMDIHPDFGFGYAMSVSGQYLLVGAPYARDYKGTIYLFSKGGATTAANWSEVTTFAGDAYSGLYVSMSGAKIAGGGTGDANIWE